MLWGKLKQGKGRGRTEVEVGMDREVFSKEVTVKGGPEGREKAVSHVKNGNK